MRTRVPAIVLAALVTCGLSACGSSTGAASCGPIVHDRLDPGSGTHVLPGSPTPTYIMNPPTSGAHQPGPKITGPVSEPIAAPLQVGVLEEGRVLIQYEGISNSEVAELEKLDSPDVVVAPAKGLPDSTKVAATAWVTHQYCRAVDVPTLRAFVKARAGKGPAHG